MARNAEESCISEEPFQEESRRSEEHLSTAQRRNIFKRFLGQMGSEGGEEVPSTWKNGSASEKTSSSEAEEEDPFLPPRPRRPPAQSGSSSSGDVVVPMNVDTCEDLWTRLHDVRINGCELEYIGRGKSIYDNGLAQSNTPLTPMNHYYEVTIIQPGESCYIAIGLARKDYPTHKHPGWNRGSIAYHADDGKIFIGSGIGTPFGDNNPCIASDVLGCGIVFPSHIRNAYGSSSKHHENQIKWPWDSTTDPPGRKSPIGQMENVVEGSSESEDDIWWNNRNQVYEDKVQVFFMRNGKLLGMKEIRIPKGGFYPTIGMMSRNEKVMVDMNPLTG